MLWMFLFAIGWIGLGIISLGTMFLAVFPKYFSIVNYYNINFRLIILGVGFFYFALFIEKLLRLFKKEEAYYLDTENGKIRITISALNTLIKKEITKRKNLKLIKMKNSINKKGVYVKIEIEILETDNVSLKLKTIQEDIKNRTKEVFDIEVKSVDIVTSKVKDIVKVDNIGDENNADRDIREIDS
ncbi:hypothetical protein EV215_1859 [Hypnocyclicus thermotrophus]|uniref:Alkaline shock response membrane anchor protein AmaP n=1 Tax=Hypnocyclicus thermotrophus TaxID=1627895 RepID=A0AA46DX50_9FUSO|nr:alkaline shock response membrane anchor protein AmaP [Hypnocyclicus thermotrophus]TDT67856.1 hypothetical protein EV215_1859 [Hypnocyclicus thermotrophus]